MNSHPYYPPSLQLPLYTPNSLETWQLFLAFGGLTVGLVGAYWLCYLRRRKLDTWDARIAIWFYICGLSHMFFEGYFVLAHRTLPASRALPAQFWKEYALCDSRYLTEDAFVLTIEALSVVFWGPLSFLASLAVADGRPSRHVLQVVVSMAHVHGCLLYFFTARVEGDVFCRPEGKYYWGYLVGLNAPWVVVPLLLIKQSYGVLTRAVMVSEEVGARKRE